jgi:hypothetical protein
MDRQALKKHCYYCREMRGDRDDHKCIDCKNNIYQETFYFDDTKEVVANLNYKSK